MSTAEAALDRVRELHHPIEDDSGRTICSACSHSFSEMALEICTPYPCPTIQAIEG